MERRTLKPHDPLPGGHSVVLMRRFAEDAPDRLAIEMIVTNPDRSEETSTPTGADGMPLGWDASLAIAEQRAEAEGLRRIWTVDRTATAGGVPTSAEDLVDDDLEDGEPGADLRDIDRNTAPRRF